MPLQYVGGASGVGTSSGYTVSLTSLTGGIDTQPRVGDIVVVASGFGSTASSAPTITGNNNGAYTGHGTASYANDTYDTNFRLFSKVMGATPDTSLTVVRTTNTAYGGATVVQVWRGQHATTPVPVVGTPATTTNGSRGNPPAVTPTANGCIVIAAGAGCQGASGSAFTVPSGMGNAVSVNADGTTSDIGVWIASAAGTNGVAYNPPAWTGGTTNTFCSAAAQTIVLAPQPSLTENFTGSGGATSGGSAGVTIALTAEGTGGATASGSAEFSAQSPINDNFNGSGGATAGGSAAVSKALIAGGLTGGGTSGGSASFDKWLVATGSGGATASGVAEFSKTFGPSFTGSGGATASGSVQFTVAFTSTGSGGATGSGTAVLGPGHVGTGGATSSGSAPFTKTLVVACSGGTSASGSATFTLSLTRTGTGGATASGSADFSTGGAYSYTGQGGGTASGSATFSAAYTVPSSGGSSASGHASVDHGYLGKGGGESSGSVEHNKILTFIGVGGALAAGFALLTIGLTHEGTGGAVASGSATVSFSRASSVRPTRIKEVREAERLYEIPEQRNNLTLEDPERDYSAIESEPRTFDVFEPARIYSAKL